MVSFILASFSTFAQSEAKSDTNNKAEYSEILTSIKPVDESPAVFPTQEELDEKIADKIDKIKQLIIENRENPIAVEQLRKDLWRFENAVVIELKK